MKLTTAVLIAITLGVATGVAWFFNRPVDPYRKTDEVAKRAGFSSGSRYGESLRLSDKVRKEGGLSEDDFSFLRQIVMSEGESGQLLALSIILPLQDPNQMRKALMACKEAVLNPSINIMPQRVLTSYRNRHPSVVEEFVSEHPEAARILEPGP